MQLINTIEITPWGYTKQDYELPKGSKIELPEEWSKNWYQCLSDSGLQNLVPIEFASYFIDITTLGDFELKIIIQKELEDIDLMNYDECVPRFCGGIVIKENDKIIIDPQCCADLNNLEEWLDIFNQNKEEWHQLWIGHPWIFYKINNEFIEFSDNVELNLSDFKDICVKHRIPKNWLKFELEKAKENQVVFEQRIAKILFELNINHADDIAKKLAGNA